MDARFISVVILLPYGDGGSRLGKRREQWLVGALVSDTVVKAFDEAVLHRLAGGDIAPLNTRFLAPFEDGHTGHLRPIVRDSRLRPSPPGNEAIRIANRPSARKECVCDKAHAFPGEVVDDSQNTEVTTVSERHRLRIQAPALVWV